MEVYIGCSGYYYSHWKGLFYPATLPRNQWLNFYAQYFNTVEINNTFYKMPQEKTIRNWYDISPEGFIFTLKGFRYITHLKRLTFDETLLDYILQFQRLASVLKEKAGPVLWQFPGSFKADTERLEKFCAQLSYDFQHVFEFRDPSWFTPAVYAILEKYHHTLCIVSAPGNIPEVVMATSDMAYARLHGKNSWYNDNYSDQELQLWKQRLEQLPVKKLFVYFNNDIGGHAVFNGQYLASLFGSAPLKRPDSQQMQLF
jgi:uncharacterized protein YecE (DUF72 family)